MAGQGPPTMQYQAMSPISPPPPPYSNYQQASSTPQQAPMVPQPYPTHIGYTPQQVPPMSSYPQQPQQSYYQQLPLEKQQIVQQVVQSIPPEKLQQIQQAYPPQQQQPYQQFAPPPTQQQGFAASSDIPTYQGPPTTPGAAIVEEQKTGRAKRFLGDTLVGRFARASVQTASSAMKMPAALSPWGDNNPVTLPNVRYRDAVLFTTFAFVGAPIVDGADSIVGDIFGADSFVSELVSSGAGAIVGSTVIKYGVFQIVEQALDKGIIEHMLPEEEKMTQTLNVKSLQVGIKHKLMGVDADIRYHGVYPTRNSQGIEKGWFCPYFFASSRTPLVPRANDFSIAQFFGPFVGADYALAHKLLSESTHVLSLCPADPNINISGNRLILLFTAISPFRGGMWSTSRRPGCGTLIFHLLDGCPALVVPVNQNAPIVAWSPWTGRQMQGGTGGYDAERQHGEICEWLDGIILQDQLDPRVREKYVDVLGRSVSLVINGAIAAQGAPKTVLGKVDWDRSGIVAFRY